MKAKVENFSKNIIPIYKKNAKALSKFSSNSLLQYRNSAIDYFTKNPVIPNKKQENYLQTDLSHPMNKDYFYYLSSPEFSIKKSELFKCDIPSLDSYSSLLVNGWYFENEGNKITKLSSGVMFGSYLEARRQFPELIKDFADKNQYTEPLSVINSVFSQDGFFLYIPDNVVVEHPFQLINLVSAHEAVMLFPKSLIILGKNAQAKVILCEHSIFPEHFLNNSTMEVFSGENSNLEFIRMQNAHNQSTQLSNTYFYQKEDSNIINNTVILHGGLVRNNIYAYLNGENCNNEMYGLYLVDKDQHVDNFTFINHQKPNSTSIELFKGILDDNATGSFAGRILVDKDAQLTNAFQTNNNILLTDKAKINTKPQLEIYADDVKCSHGATVGQIDEEALFYMRSRGIYKKDARLMLLHAFAAEITSKISIPLLRLEIETLVNKRLRGNLSRCNQCKIIC